LYGNHSIVETNFCVIEIKVNKNVMKNVISIF